MRNLKRFLAIALTILMVSGCFSMFSVNAFDDVYDFEEAIETLNELGVIKGYDDTTFGPDDDVLRWHMALLVAKLSTGEVRTSTWEKDTNSTKFVDVRPEHYYGSIAWASATGVIIGTSDTTFEPEGQIMFQDALTMTVRALGFSGDAMDKGYPWKYIEKAEDLGLISGLEYIDDYEAYLTRGETAQLLYNALFAENAEGETFGEACFDLEAAETMTVVLTATNRLNMLNNNKVIKNEYVGFNPLNEDGTLNENLTYYVNKAEFGIEDDEDKYVGNVYKVYSRDDYATFEKADLIAGNSEVEIAGNVNNNSGLVSIDGETYKVVENYSRLYNTGEYIGNYPEIILYAKDGSYAKTNVTYVTDSFGNLLDAKGQIVLYYMPQLVGFVNPYVVIDDSGAIRASVATDFDKAAVYAGETVAAYEKITNTLTDITKVGAVYDATVYDVNGDGTYDRGIYVNYSYGAYGVDANGCLTIGSVATGKKPGEIKFVDAEGNEIDAIGNGYYLYSYNAQGAILTIKEQLTVYSGYLSGLNTVADTLIIGGTVYSYGIANLPAAEAADVEKDVKAALIGKNINYVMYDGVVIDILPVATAGYVVLDSVIGVTSSGLPTVLVYNSSDIASVIVVSTLDTYTHYQYNFGTDVLTSITAQLSKAAKGTVYSAQIDALGYYHLTTAESALKTNNTGADAVIDFKNGITNAGAITGQFTADANTVFLLFNGTSFESRKGIPANGATLTINAGSEYLVVMAGNTAKFVYVRGGGSFAGLTTRPSWENPNHTTIVYIDNRSSIATVVENGLSSVIGVDGMTLLGYTYKYSAVVDVVNGKTIDVYSVAYNAQVKAGRFYSVVNGYIDREIDITAADSPIKVGYLDGITGTTGTFVAAGTTTAESYDRESSTLFYLGADGNVVRTYEVDATSTSVAAYNYAEAKKAEIVAGDNKYLPVLYYAGDIINPTSRTYFAVDANTAVGAQVPALNGWGMINGSQLPGEPTPPPTPVTYTVTYAGGEGATGTAPTQAAVEAGTTITLKANTFTKTGYEFAGWSDGTANYAAGASYTVNGDVTFTAQWTEVVVETFTVTYAGGEGATGTAPTQDAVEAGTQITLAENTFTKEGYTFKAWDINGVEYAAGESYTVNANTTITAVWTENTVTPEPVEGLIHDLTTGGWWGSVMEVTTVDGKTARKATLNNDGGVYPNWGVVCGNLYDAGATAADASEYANYYIDIYVEDASKVTQLNLDITSVKNAPTAEYSKRYEITGLADGWNTVALTDEICTATGANFTWEEVYFIHANFLYTEANTVVAMTNFKGEGTATPPAPTTYEVTYVGGEGATGTAPTQAAVEAGTQITLADNTFTKEGYTFKAWDIGGTEYAAGATYTVTAATTITAVWTENTVTPPVTTAVEMMRILIEDNAENYKTDYATKDVSLQLKGEDINGVQSIILAFDKTKVIPVATVAGATELAGDYSFAELLDALSVDYANKFANNGDIEGNFLTFPAVIKDGPITVLDKWTVNGVAPVLSYAEVDNIAYLYIIVKQEKTVDYSDYQTAVTLRFAVLDGEFTADSIRVATKAEANALNASCSATVATTTAGTQTIYGYYGDDDAETTMAKPTTVYASTK